MLPQEARPLPSPKIVKGSILIYRAFDIGEEINLPLVESVLRQGKYRVKIARGERNALIMRNPPVRLSAGETSLLVSGQAVRAETLITVWDYGVLSVLFQVPIAENTPWNQLISTAASVNGDLPGSDNIDHLARKRCNEIAAMIQPCIGRPNDWATFEDYAIYFIQKIEGITSPAQLISTGLIPELILGEPQEKLALKSRTAILENSFQYAEDDLVTLDWNSAVVVEPSGAREIPDTIEFALTHLLEFRYYDDLLDRRLAHLYDSLERRKGGIWRSNYARISQEANARFIEFSEFIERVDNSLKVVGDFYLAVIFRNAVRRFRIPDWEQSITRKMNTLARVSQLLQSEINVHRGHVLEMIIILLIGFEIVSAIFKT